MKNGVHGWAPAISFMNIKNTRMHSENYYYVQQSLFSYKRQ